MENISDNTLYVAKIFDAVEEAYICIDAATRFAEYLMEDIETQEEIEENIQKLEVVLPDAKVWIDTAMENAVLLKKELEV